MIDHVSVQNSFDGNIDITRVGTRDVTVQWSILAEPAGEEKNMLLAFGQSRITLHHNLFIDAEQRSPQVTFDDSDRPDPRHRHDARHAEQPDLGLARRVRNAHPVRRQRQRRRHFYSSDGGDEDDALIICKGLLNDSECYSDTTNIARAYVAGNVSADGVNLNNRGTEGAVPGASPHHAGACSAARDAMALAGARPLDAVDQQYLATVSLAACPAVSPTADGRHRLYLADRDAHTDSLRRRPPGRRRRPARPPRERTLPRGP